MSHILLKGWHRYKEKGKYSWKSSLVIAFVATMLLWWLPIFGPMLSGYVSGRTSGSKYKGIIITAILGLFGLILYFHLLDRCFPFTGLKTRSQLICLTTLRNEKV